MQLKNSFLNCEIHILSFNSLYLSTCIFNTIDIFIKLIHILFHISIYSIYLSMPYIHPFRISIYIPYISIFSVYLSMYIYHSINFSLFSIYQSIPYIYLQFLEIKHSQIRDKKLFLPKFRFI